MNPLPGFGTVLLFLRVAIGVLLIAWGVIFGVPPLYGALARRLRRLQERVRFAQASPEIAARLASARARRRAVMVEPPQWALSALGGVMALGGIGAIGGWLDVGVVVAAVWAICVAAIVGWAARTRSIRTEPRVAALKPRTFPPGISWPVFVLPLVQLPLLVFAALHGDPAGAATVGIALLLTAASAYYYARASNSALFGADVAAEKIVDDATRSVTVLVFALFAFMGPLLYFFTRALAGSVPMEIVWIEVLVVGGFTEQLKRVTTRRKEAVASLAADA